jgi:hypothetical protein
MPPFRNVTSAAGSSTAHFQVNDNRPETRLSHEFSRARNNPEILRLLQNATRSNADLPPPVLAGPTFQSSADFANQAGLDRAWSALTEHLRTTTLSEQEMLDILSSGILQTKTGQVLAGLLADAMLRSIRPVGELTKSRLQVIVKVICDLPPSQWQTALGENVRFPSGQNGEGVTGFIQSHLNRSSAQRDERIANNELMPDEQWEAIKQIAKQARSYIRASDGALDGKLLMLEALSKVRPTPHNAHEALRDFIHELKNPSQVARVRWPDGFATTVEAVLAQISPVEVIKPTWFEWIVGPSWLDSFSQGAGTLWALLNQTKVQDARASDERGPTLLSHLQTIERNADFYTAVSTKGPRVPEGFVGKLLYVCNALNTVRLLRLDSSHISTSRPNPEPSGHAWKNGATDLPSRSFTPAPEHPDVVTQSLMNQISPAQFAAQVDEVATWLINTITPWNTAYASELEKVVVMLDPLKVRVDNPAVEHSHDSALWSRTPDMEALRQQLGEWLSRMSGTLISTGAAVMSRTGDLIERHPRSAVGIFAAYMGISGLYTNWFKPVPEIIDPSRIGAPELEVMPDEAALIYEAILEDVEDLFEEQPDFAAEIAQRVSQSEYLDPVDDPQLIEDVEELLQQSFPDMPDMTYQSMLAEMMELSTSDVEGESEDELDDENVMEAQVFAYPFRDSEEMAGVRNKRDVEVNVGPKGVFIRIIIAKAVVDASNRRLQEVTPVQQPDEEIAPGVTVDQAAQKVIATFEAAQKISDPYKFLAASISNLFAEHSSLRDKAAGITANTSVNVVYTSVKPFSLPPFSIEVKKFTLAEVCIDTHLRGSSFNERVEVAWPQGMSSELKDAISSANFQDDYKKLINEVVNRPDVAALWRLKKEKDVEFALNSYLKTETRSAEGATIVNVFLSGDLHGELVFANSKERRERWPLSDAIYLSGKSGYGLLVLLNERKVVEVPKSWAEGEEKAFVPSDLKKDIADRIRIEESYGRVDADYEPQWPFKEGGRYYWSYEPLVPSGHPDENIIETLYKVQVDKVLSDVDALVSTGWERLADGALDAAGKLLVALSIAVGFVPVAGVPVSAAARAAGAFLLGLSSTGTDAVRAILADDPATRELHEKNALRGVIMDFAGPLASKLLGSAFTKGANSKITHKVLEILDLKRIPRSLAKQFNDIPKWIPAKVRSSSKIQALRDRKFRNHNVIDKLNHLADGPRVAEKLAKQTGVRYFANPQSGYVHEGFLLRGEKFRNGMPTFKENAEYAFEHGFELTHPIKNVKQVNGMKGGFGGGKNQADWDGRGISTSPYLSEGGAGAHHYGAGRPEGGITYVIDARGTPGFDLYANRNYADRPPIELGSKPLEINFGEKIPGSRVLGAYDKLNKFWPNPLALQEAIRNSVPIMDGAVHGLVKPLARFVNVTSAAKPAV